MKIAILQTSKYEELKQQFFDAFSNRPWFDRWEDEKQLEIYLHELIANQNSLSLVMLDIMTGLLALHWVIYFIGGKVRNTLSKSFS